MPELIWLMPALPFAGSLLLLFARRFPPALAAGIGVGAVGLSMCAAAASCAFFLFSPPAGGSLGVTLWSWIDVGGFAPRVAFRLDALSLTMVLVVTVVGFLIHLYSAGFMEREEGFSRFFAAMNLFIGSMLVLVLADDFLLLYLGWEGVGLCSYLLIGFWYGKPENGRAARKAFIVTRVGDAALAIGLFLIATELGSLAMPEVFARAALVWPRGSGPALAAAALLLGGAIGKSVQLPLQTWLPDAMAGPTPVSALIHAATMVTAGVYLVARCNAIFSLAPAVQLALAVVGAATLIVGGVSAAFQRNIKRVLAYSTMSQIGYMFLALGVGSWAGAVFHLVTHALFKSLLFLAAGAVILALHHEEDMRRMGGLARRMPLAFWTFMAGALALCAIPVPPTIAGFASKEAILAQAWSSAQGGALLWGIGVTGAFLTSLYTFRMIALVFLGPSGPQPEKRTGAAMAIPLAVLSAACLAAGLLGFPKVFGGRPVLLDFLGSALPSGISTEADTRTEMVLEAAATAVSVAGAIAGWLLGMRGRRISGTEQPPAVLAGARAFFAGGWGFDRVYETLIVRPFAWLARVNKSDAADLLPRGIGGMSMRLSGFLRRSQNGRVRWYAASIAVGSLIVIALAVLL